MQARVDTASLGPPSSKACTVIREHERVVLTAPVTEEGLEAGDVGTVVHVHKDGQAYEVEFVTPDGRTVAVVTVEALQVRPFF